MIKISNPEKGVYLGNLTEDLDLVYFSKNKTFGVFYTEKLITAKNEPWQHKMPVETDLNCSHPRTWNKYSKETEKVINIALAHGDEIGFESHIRKAIIEILDSVREVNKLMTTDEVQSNENEDLILIEDWKPCKDCECYECYQTGDCGHGCENPNKQCIDFETEIKECNFSDKEGCTGCKERFKCDLRG